MVQGDGLDWGPVNFQPSELVKVALALYMADSLSKKGENIKKFFTNGVFPYLLIIAILGLLLIKQPDLGMQ